MNYHNSKKHCAATAGAAHIFKKYDTDFHSFYILREHKQNEHGAQTRPGIQNFDVADVMGDVDDNSLKGELEECKHFERTVTWRMGDTGCLNLLRTLLIQTSHWKS